MTRAGFVTLVGRPNAGKSTLLNRLVGERLAIVSPKPQSTRERVVGILTDGDGATTVDGATGAPGVASGDAEGTQIVFLDTPGLLEPRYALHRSMRHAAQLAIADADVIVYLVDASVDQPGDLAMLAGLPAPPRAPVLVVLNKADRCDESRRQQVTAAHPDALLVSATTGQGIDELLAAIRARLPKSPFLYGADDVSSQQMRFFVREFLRESVLEQLEDEVPYGVAVEIEEYREGSVPVYIRAVMHVERESQKRILIGAGGARIKAIGQATRAKLEPLVGAPVFLDLWVKVLHNWRRDAAALARLGYRLPDGVES